MARDRWHEQLEAYLDRELDPDEQAAFEAAMAADPDLQAELNARRAFSEDVTPALSGDLPPDLAELARGIGRQTDRSESRRHDRRWQVAVLAATLALMILVPTLLRDDQGAAGPRSITTAGPVTAVHYGEQPSQTAVLEAGCYDLAVGNCR